MVIRQLTEKHFNNLNTQLIQKAQNKRISASYQILMKVDKTEYTLLVQPEKKRKLAILQALRISRERDGVFHELITDNCFLSALLELLIRQGVNV